MFCRACGRQLPDTLRFCDGCGADAQPPAASVAVGTPSQQFTNEVRARSADAWEGIKAFAVSPVGGLAASYARFEHDRAFWVGLVFLAIYELLLLAGLLLFRTKAASFFGGFISLGALESADVVKVLLLAAVPFVSLVGASVLARAIFRGTGVLAGDVYTSGAVLLPIGVWVFVTMVLGAANLEISAVLALFALTYTILMLYAGCSRIGGIPEAGAAPAVPIMLLVSAWLTKVIIAALW